VGCPLCRQLAGEVVRLAHREDLGEDDAVIFTETKLEGAFMIALERIEDDRGFFSRTFCRREFRDHSLDPDIAQASIALNLTRGTVRGMHFQWPPSAEVKVVRCTRGAILDVIVDLRPESATYLEHIAVELTTENRLALYVPKRFAHGYQTLEDQTEVSYQMTEFYAPDLAGGLAYDDPELQLDWPLTDSTISSRDFAWRSLRAIESELRRRMRTSGAEEPDLEE
jgi:dTDP-4-dehydrorhamnose 3,5-epimerase